MYFFVFLRSQLDLPVGSDNQSVVCSGVTSGWPKLRRHFPKIAQKLLTCFSLASQKLRKNFPPASHLLLKNCADTSHLLPICFSKTSKLLLTCLVGRQACFSFSAHPPCCLIVKMH
jgi:hypothetical protein